MIVLIKFRHTIALSPSIPHPQVQLAVFKPFILDHFREEMDLETIQGFAELACFNLFAFHKPIDPASCPIMVL
jgi:hypothetical protein